MSTIDNPLLQPFDKAPFSQIKNEHFIPAFKALIAEAKAEVEAIISNKEAATFANTIEALEFSGEQLELVSSVFFNLNSAETNKEIQQIAQEVSPWLTEFGNDITLNEDLFKRIRSVYEQKGNLNLTPEQLMLLDKKYKGFTRNGANLNAADKEKLRAIDKELSSLKLKYNENNLAETNAYEMLLTDETQLAGLPDGEREAAAKAAKQKGKDGWLITLANPSFVPFMKYSQNRDLRKQLAIASGARAFQQNEYNNEENVLRIAKLRHERANLLGYKTHADYVLEERMAGNPEKVLSFLHGLLTKAKPYADKEIALVTDFARQTDGLDKLEKWDFSYYSEKLRSKLFDFDDQVLKPYFKLENVVDGAFQVAGKLFGLTFTEVFDIEKYHEDVKTYEVRDRDRNNELIAVFYADYFPREGKRAGAWMSSFRGQFIKDGENHRPQIINVANFTKPTDTKPSLLTFNEVTTLFHEFGHGLHGMLANTHYPSLSGTSVYWDFVELPSQLMENWCYEKECLELFARHYETGELIPMEYVDKISESATFLEGIATVRQISFGLLDMAWHGTDPSAVTNVKEYEMKAMDGTSFFTDVKENCMSVSFAHIFAGGYSSGYYSYKWAEVLDADAFEFFEESGIFNPTIGAHLRETILSKGGTEHPMELYKRFRGQEPKQEALLKRAGLA